MNTAMLAQAQVWGVASWARFVKLYPKLRVYGMPSIVLNNRLKTTAGQCAYESRTVELCTVLLRDNPEAFRDIIIPHELAHQVCFDVFKVTGHCDTWKSIMVAYGIPPDRCHTLINPEHTAKVQTRAMEKMAAEFFVGDRAQFVHRNRQRVQRNIVGVITKINFKTVKLTEDHSGVEWTIPKLNTCNLKHT